MSAATVTARFTISCLVKKSWDAIITQLNCCSHIPGSGNLFNGSANENDLQTSDMTSKVSSCAIIGGGISGLSAAWYLQQLSPETHTTLFEASDQIGGVLQTVRMGDFLIEQAADMFVAQPDHALQLCREIGIADRLMTTNRVADRAYIGLGEKVSPVPRGLSMMVPTLEQPVLQSNLLSDIGKQRFLSEDQIAPAKIDGPHTDESLKSFAIRRFGIEAYEKIIQPMVSGIYTADPERLSMNATMKRFVDMEQSAGSLIAAHRAKRSSTDGAQVAESKEDQSASGARYSMFRAPVGGIAELPRGIADRMPAGAIRRGQRVTELERSNGRWNVSSSNAGGRQETDTFDSLIVATPAAVTARLLQATDATLAEELGGIETASSAIVVLGVKKAQIKKPFDGFGIIYPHVDNGQVIAISFSSNKFSGRCGDDQFLIRVFIGGALQSELVDLDDESLFEIAIKQLDRSLGFSDAPIFRKIFRWRKCMPQYHIGHLERVKKIEALAKQLPGFALAGNSYHGVGIPACVKSGKDAAGKISSFLSDAGSAFSLDRNKSQTGDR